MTTRHLAYLFVIALAGCPDSSGGDDNACFDPHYNDGTCDVHLSCDVPDIDCFQTFSSDAEAATWWTTTGGPLVGQSFPTIPESDPRFAKVRTALDKGWDAFNSHRPVGLLAGERPALVIVDKPQLQFAAFVVGDSPHNSQPFVVMVETPALALGVDDSALLGVMMHELQHAVGLHKLGDVAETLRAFYTAPSGSEPLGRDQSDDPGVRAAGLAWQEGAKQVGPYSQLELGGLPVSGLFQTYLVAVANDGLQNNPNGCTASVGQIADIDNSLSGAEDPLDGSLPAELSQLQVPITNALAAFRNGCLAGSTFGVIDVGAALAKVTPAQFEATLDAHDLALVKNKLFVDGLTAIVSDRRTAMRNAEAAFEAAGGEPWTQLRYFSFEEDADDVSEIVMGAAGFDPTSTGNFFLAVLPAASRTQCLAQHLPGYGVDLTDDHHATCWRIGHLEREAAGTTRARAATSPSTEPIAVRMPGHILAAPNPTDHIAN